MAQKTLLFTEDLKAAETEVEQLGGRVVHKFSPTAFVAELPDTTDPTALKASAAEPTQPLDANIQLMVDAWLTTRQARDDKAPRPGEGLRWDTSGYQPPLEFGTPRAKVAESSGTPTSLYLIGSVAVGLVLVSRIGSPTGEPHPETMSEDEVKQIIAEVQEGLDWLATFEPRARVSFSYSMNVITVDTPPGPYVEFDPYENMEEDWRDDALQELGYEGGRDGYQQYAEDLRTRWHTDWAYVAFITKYPLHHFAYAINEKVVMNYPNGAWGPRNINSVFAHETCHIFGAADEYGECDCGGSHGHFGVPNSNCVNCFPPGTQVACLMDANNLDLCDFSRRQIGWVPSLLLRDQARYVSDKSSIPGFMKTDETVNAHVTMRNAGTTTWTTAEGYHLASNDRWGVSRVNLPHDVAPGQEVRFDFALKAPSEAGSYSCRWMMHLGGGRYFEEPTLNPDVIVTEALRPFSVAAGYSEFDLSPTRVRWEMIVGVRYIDGGREPVPEARAFLADGTEKEANTRFSRSAPIGSSPPGGAVRVPGYPGEVPFEFILQG